MFFKQVSLLCIFSFLILAIWHVNVTEAQYVTDGLIAMWTLDEADIAGDTVKDVSGNGNDAKIMGTLESVEGVIDECLKFNRGANYVEIPDMGEFEQVSVECWAYTVNLGHDYQGIVSTWQWTAGKVHFKFQGNQIQVDKNGAGKIVSPAQVDTWYHIVYTTDVPAALKLYVDGELAAEGTGGAQLENWHERRIGSEHDGRYLDGMMDEVRVYDRVLDEDEVKQNFGVKSHEAAITPAGKVAATWGQIKK